MQDEGLSEPGKSGGYSDEVLQRVASKIMAGSDLSPVKSAKAMLEVRRLSSMAKWGGPRNPSSKQVFLPSSISAFSFLFPSVLKCKSFSSRKMQTNNQQSLLQSNFARLGLNF
jgi:hypothetical protein